MHNGFTHETPVQGKTNIWLTPPNLIRQLGEFDLDPCFLPDGQRPWDTAKKHYSEEDDGLAQQWEGRVWMNPPYGKETPKWMEKLANHGNGIALIYARVETKWFQQSVWLKADAIFFPEGRIKFRLPDGTECNGSPGCGSCFVAYGEENADALFEGTLNMKGRFIDLNH